MTEPDTLQQVDRTHVVWRGRKLSYFSGCDYYRLTRHPAVLKAAGTAAQRFGLNVAASRLTTGNHSLYLELEKRLRSFFDAEDALVVHRLNEQIRSILQSLLDQAQASRRSVLFG